MDGEFRAHIWKGEQAWLNQRVCCFRPKQGVPTGFLADVLRRPLSECERGKVGTTVIHLGKSDIDAFRILHPGDKLLTVFGEGTASLLDQTVRNANKSRVSRRLRDTLLPKLVSGEVRLPAALVDRYAEPGAYVGS